MTVAVLALQGAFIEHEQMLHRLGVETVEIRQLRDWQSYYSLPPQGKAGMGAALILPGGESTVQMRLLRELGLFEPIRQAIADGMPVLGTCAGMILLSEGRLGTMDVEVRRNAYGRQLGSFHTVAAVKGIGDDVPMTFIRAPYIERVLSERVEVLSTVDGHIVATRQGNQLATAFHPELDDDTRLHEMLLGMMSAICFHEIL
jgi:5'-phosphate synthase pdxT subunit